MNSFIIFLIALGPGLILVHHQKKILSNLNGKELETQEIKQQGFWEWTEWVGKWICLPSVIAVALMECCGGNTSSIAMVFFIFLIAYSHNLLLFTTINRAFNLTQGLSKKAHDALLVPLNRTQTSHADLNFLSNSAVTYTEGIQLYAHEQIIGTFYTILLCSDSSKRKKALKKLLINPATTGILLFMMIISIEWIFQKSFGHDFQELSFVIRRLPASAFTYVSLVILSAVIYDAFSVKENFEMVKKFFLLLSVIAMIKLLWMPELMSLLSFKMNVSHLSSEFDAFARTLCSTSSLLFIKDKYARLMYAAAFIVMLGYYSLFESAGLLGDILF